MTIGVAPVVPTFQFLDSNGRPLALGSVTVYLAGTTTPTNTWQNRDLDQLNQWPVPLDAAGRCTMWLDATLAYKFLLKNALGAEQFTVDNVSGAAGSAAQITFIQDGTGAVIREAQDKMREWVSVADFGAVADGTDCSAAVQLAVNEANAKGASIVLFPEGSARSGPSNYYNLGTTTINIPCGSMKLMGQKYTKIRKTGAGAFFDIAVIGEGFEVDGLWFVGDNTDGAYALKFTGADNGSYMQGILNAHIHDCWFEGVGKKETVTDAAGGAIYVPSQCLGMNVEHNICSQGGFLMRVTAGSDGIKISNNVSNISRSVAIQFEGTAGSSTVEISNNNLANVGGAVFLKAAGYVNIFGNTCIPGESEAGALGALVKRTINMDGSVSLTEDAGGVSAAFWISSAQQTNINENVCSFGGSAQAGDYGIYLSNLQATCWVGNNFVTGQTLKAIRVWGGQPQILVNNRSSNALKDDVYSDSIHPGIQHSYTVASPYSHWQAWGTSIPQGPFEFAYPAHNATDGFSQMRASNATDPTEYLGMGWDDGGSVGYIQAYKTGTGYRTVRMRSPMLFLGGSGDTTALFQAGASQGSNILYCQNNAASITYFKVGPTGRIGMANLPGPYADNTAAAAAGVAVGDLYRQTTTGAVMVVF